MLPARGRTIARAMVLVGLLLAIVALGIGISFRIYTQLDNAARLQRVLVGAQQRLDDVVNIQLEQEAGLRGYLATGNTVFLNSYTSGTQAYADALDAFSDTTGSLDIPEVGASVKEMRQLHDSWTRQVAEPLLAHPHASNAVERETLGKVLIDQLRGDTTRIRDLLETELAVNQAQLKTRIDQALFGGLASVVIFGGVSILFVSSRVQMQAVIDRERSIVETLETAFRSDLDAVPGARIGTAYLSADLDAAVGGDLYDVRRLDENRALVLVADVSGKGIVAAVNTAFVKYSVRTLARRHRDPGTILDEFNTIFLETVSDPNLFVVMFVGVLDTASGTLTYASAGHSQAYVRHAGGVTGLRVTGPVVGLDKTFTFETNVAQLAAGDLVLLATDGLTEARGANGEILDDAGARALLAGTSADPQRCADEIVEAVRKMSGGTVADDLALLAIAIDGRN